MGCNTSAPTKSEEVHMVADKRKKPRPAKISDNNKLPSHLKHRSSSLSSSVSSSSISSDSLHQAVSSEENKHEETKNISNKEGVEKDIIRHKDDVAENKEEKAKKRKKQKSNGLLKKLVQKLLIKDENLETKDSKLETLLKANKIDENPELNENYILFLDMHSNPEGVEAFIRTCESLRADALRKISIIGMNKMSDKTLKELKSLVFKSHLKRLKVLYLHGDGHMPLSKISEFLPHLLNITTKQVFLDSFKINQSDLEILLTESYYTQRLSLVNCTIGDLPEPLTIKHSKRPLRLNELDLYWTLGENENNNVTIFNNVLKSVTALNLKQPLKRVHLSWQDFTKDEVKQIVADVDLENTEIKHDSKQPKAAY